MKIAQMVLSGIVSVYSVLFYLIGLFKFWQHPEYYPDQRGPITVFPTAFTATVVFWFIASIMIERRKMWAYLVCLAIHLIVFSFAIWLVVEGLLIPSKKYDIFPPILGTIVGMPLAAVSGIFLFWLIVKRSEVLGTKGESANHQRL